MHIMICCKYMGLFMEKRKKSKFVKNKIAKHSNDSQHFKQSVIIACGNRICVWNAG